MNDAERRVESSRWLQYAYEDLRAAQGALENPEFVPRHSCYDAQQAAEKTLKAALIFLGIEFLYRHDLEYLNSLLPPDWQIDDVNVDLEQLTDWGATSRYPGDIAPPTEDDARAAAEQAEAIHTFIVRKTEDSWGSQRSDRGDYQ